MNETAIMTKHRKACAAALRAYDNALMAAAGLRLAEKIEALRLARQVRDAAYRAADDDRKSALAALGYQPADSFFAPPHTPDTFARR